MNNPNRERSLIGVTPELLRTCLRVMEWGKGAVDYCEEDCIRSLGEGSARHKQYVQWNADYAKAVAELKAILGDK